MNQMYSKESNEKISKKSVKKPIYRVIPHPDALEYRLV